MTFQSVAVARGERGCCEESQKKEDDASAHRTWWWRLGEKNVASLVEVKCKNRKERKQRKVISRRGLNGERKSAKIG